MQKEVPKTFAQHVDELRRLIVRPLLVMALITGLAFWKGQWVVDLLQKPLKQTLYYSSPIGGFTFIFQVAIVCGLIVALPFFIRSLIKFLEPIMPKITGRRLLLYLFSSICLAALGVACGYLVSMPAALHFLNGFESTNLKPLISANEYLSFTLVYLAGFAALFQLPLVIIIINRIKPLKPSQLMKYQRWMILGSFIAAAILTPTPDIVNQLIFAAPIIILYEVSVVLVWVINLKRKPQADTMEWIEENTNDELSSHPVGALYQPQLAPEVAQVPKMRPIDVILSGSSLTQG